MYIHGKEIKAVVSDFDGTIIKRGAYEPPARFFEVVEALLDKGLVFVAASGRQYDNLRHMMAPVADRIEYVAENGCLVMYRGERIYKSSFDRATAMELIDRMKKEEGASILASGERVCYILKGDEAFEDRMRNKVKNNVAVVQNLEDIGEDFIKISIFWSKGIPEASKQDIRRQFGSRLQVVDSGNGWLDCNLKEAGKGPALKVLAGYMGIPVEQMIAFGDSENDISMLQEAGISYAVSTALPHVRKCADYECESVEEVLQTYFL